MTDPVLLPYPRQARWSGTRVPRGEIRTARDSQLPAEGYRLRIDAGGATIDAADDAGEFYGRATLSQLSALDDLAPVHRSGSAGSADGSGTWPEGSIEDWPDLAVRGVMLDISRTKVPTVETLEALIDRLAGWKVNHVQLYTEHTFAYRGHEQVWGAASPMTADDIARLDAFCAARHVELAPNQNCLGHMERWLRHEAYRDLALSPDGFVPPWGGPPRRPTTLDPARPEAFALVQSLLAELLPNFRSGRVNVGLDEPWELPAERTPEYVGWMAKLRALPELDGHEMLVWGDILAHHPDVLGDIPPGVTVCEWGYEADHPFAERAANLGAAGRPWWVCPGTSSWNSVVGRVGNATGNCASAAKVARQFGASGWLCTDWGDNGHLQYLPISEPGLAYGAAVAWCLDTNADLDLGAALSAHAFQDPTGALAQCLLGLGELYRVPSVQMSNSSILAAPLYWPHARLGGRLGAGLSVEDMERCRAALDAAVASLRDARAARADAALVADELRNGAALMGILIDDAGARLAGDGRLESIPEGVRLTLGKRLDAVTERHRELWLARNRPGGLDESAGWLQRLGQAYGTGTVERPAVAYGP